MNIILNVLDQERPNLLIICHASMVHTWGRDRIQWSSNEMQLIKFEISQQLMLEFE